MYIIIIPVLGWSTIIRFTTGGDCCNIGDRVPAIFYNNDGFLLISSAVSGDGNLYVEAPVDFGKLYHIEIFQRQKNGQVREFNHNAFFIVN